MDNRNTLWREVDTLRPRFVELSDRVWGMPEVCYTEARSCAEHTAELKAQGFRVTERVAGIPTAVVGEAGEGGPVIAIMGEYDALPGLSQEAGVAEHRPIEPNGHGHGCGHNLLGSAALLAAAALKNWLEATGTPGRVRYYGCPAEEGGAAKAFMVRAGAFNDADIAISWHPHSFWEVTPPLSLANTRADFIFTGRAAHAAAYPHLGRSALDAVELMSVGVNYMREHMPSDARVHYALLDTGGIAPNVVQAHARVRYSIRAIDLPGMLELVGRVHKIAQGAALMTETKVEMRIISAVSNMVGNEPLEAALQGIMEELGPPHFDDEDKRFAEAIRATLSPQDIAAAWTAIGMKDNRAPLANFTVPPITPRKPMIGSTDIGDVSWVVPTVQAHAPTVAIGTAFHTWQVVAQGKSPAAHKAMAQVAKAMATLGARALTDPGLVAAAKADLAARTATTPYACPIPEGVEPPLTMSLG
ncbi:MAG: amidohydrolase [Bosea sp.]|jgi:aminobenzoyl-glutamate utilization protein B|nr:amidohydrolase [Bosea sp. (in: a-proteobacteria)]